MHAHPTENDELLALAEADELADLREHVQQEDQRKQEFIERLENIQHDIAELIERVQDGKRFL